MRRLASQWKYVGYELLCIIEHNLTGSNSMVEDGT